MQASPIPRLTQSGIKEADIDAQEWIDSTQDSNRKFYKWLAGKIPRFGDAIAEGVIDPLFSLKPDHLSQVVDRDLQKIMGHYEQGDLNKQQLTQRVVNTLLNERIPTDLRMRYLPPCLKAVGDILQVHEEALQSVSAKTDSSFSLVQQELRSGLAKIETLQEGLESLAGQVQIDASKLTEKLNAISNEISGVFDKVEDVIAKGRTTEDQLDRLKEQSTATFSAVTDLNKKLLSQWSSQKDLQERQSFDREYQRLSQNVRNAVTIFGLFGDRETAQKIGVISEAALTIGTEVAGLMGMGTLALATGPVGAALAIGACVAKVVDVCSSQGPSEGEVMMEMMMSLSRQIAELQEQMHLRFDHLDAKCDEILQTALTGLKNLEQGVAYGNERGEAIHKKLSSMDERSRVETSEVLTQIDQLAHLLKSGRNSELTSELTSELFTLLNEKSHDPRQYRRRMERLEGFAFHRSIKEASNEQEIFLSTRPVDYDCSIQTILDLFGVKTEGRAPNPSMFSMAALGILYLTLRQYPETAAADPLSRISVADLRRLGEVREQAEILLGALSQLQKGILPLDFKREISAAGEKLEAGLLAIQQKQAKDYSSLCNRSARVNQQTSYAALEHREAFKKDLPFTLNPQGGSWFGGEWWTERHKNGFATNRYRRNGTDINVAKNKYSTAIRKSIEGSRAKYLEARERSKVSAYRHQIDPTQVALPPSELKELEMPWFIFPVDFDLPTLPSPPNLSRFIPDGYKMAAAKNLGEFRFEYVVSEAKNLDIEMYWLPRGREERERFVSVSVPYDPGIYSGGEAIWWFWAGGDYPQDKVGTPNTLFWSWQYSAFPNTVKHYCNYPKIAHKAGKMEEAETADWPVTVHVKEEDSILLEQLEEERDAQVLSLKRQWIAYLMGDEVGGGKRPEAVEYDAAVKRFLAFLSCSQRAMMEDSKSRLFNELNQENTGLGTEQLVTQIKKGPAVKGKKNLEVLSWPSFLHDIFSPLLGTAGRWWSHGVLYHDCDRAKAYFDEPAVLRMIVDTVATLEERYGPYAVDYNRWNASVKTVEFNDKVLEATVGGLFEVLQAASQSDNVPSELIQSTLREVGEQISSSAEEMDCAEKEYAAGFLNALFGSKLKALTQ